MGTALRRARRPFWRVSRLWRWLALALALHGLGVGTLWLVLGPALAPPTRPSHADPELAWLDLERLPAAELAAGAGTPSQAPGGQAPSAEIVSRPLAARAATRTAARGRSRVPVASDGVGDQGVPDEGNGDAGAAGDGRVSDGAPASGGPRLGLRQLGVDGSHNPFIEGEDAAGARRRLERRLQQSLRSELARRDQARGLGPEGPAIAALGPLVLASATAPNTTALLRVYTDAGRVTRVEVLSADRDTDEWRRIADGLRRELGGKALRTAAARMSFDLRVVSRVQLPSGADPGLAVKLFGATLKEGEGSRSTQLAILSPVIQHVTIPGTRETVAVPTLALLGFNGDPADIAAIPQRVVRTHLVAMDTDLPPGDVLPRPQP